MTWTCNLCGASFASIPGDKEVERCSKCVICEEQAKRIAELEGALRDLIRLIDDSEPDFGLIGEDFPELNKARSLAKLGTGGGE